MDLDWELKFLGKLVSIPTVSGDSKAYRGMESFLVSTAKKLGGNVSVVDPYKNGDSDKPKPNIVADFDYGMKKTVAINCHYDVVPSGDGWKSKPFSMLAKNGKLYGRGTCDDKGPLALSMGLVRELNSAKNRKYNIKLVLTCDEEIGSEMGLKYLLKKKGVKGIDLALVMDAHRVPIAGCSGVVQGKFRIRGMQWHAGEDWKGKNAILDGMRFVEAMQEFKKVRAKHISRLRLSETDAPCKSIFGRFNITMIRSGHVLNVLPGEFEASFDMRLIPEEKPGTAVAELKSFMRRVVDKARIDAELEITAEWDGYITDLGNKLVKDFIKADGTGKVYGTWGGLDGRFFAEYGVPTMAYGIPLGNSTDHAANEYVVIEDMKKAKETLMRFAIG
ncbi:MAG: M20/M25/M40 family metallo-hydrolase [Candidatus Micrarchaeota archaeon]|nr:M20/M25/M40 family metallo-hydrolase [Candidatus Micrarchaeota archaeon]